MKYFISPMDKFPNVIPALGATLTFFVPLTLWLKSQWTSLIFYHLPLFLHPLVYWTRAAREMGYGVLLLWFWQPHTANAMFITDPAGKMAQWAKAALVKTLVQSLAPTWWKERTTKLSAGWARKDAAPAIGLLCSLGKGETPMFSLYQECGHLPGRRKFLLRNKPWHFDLGLLSLQN